MDPGILTGVDRTPFYRTLASSTVGNGRCEAARPVGSPRSDGAGALGGAGRGQPHENTEYEADGSLCRGTQGNALLEPRASTSEARCKHVNIERAHKLSLFLTELET